MAHLEFHIRGEGRRALERLQRHAGGRRPVHASVRAWFRTKLGSAAGSLSMAAFAILPLYALAYVSAGSQGGVLACKGRMFPRPTSGYGGDPVRVTIQFRPPTHRNVARVTMSRVTCQGSGCEAERRGPRHFVWDGEFQSEGDAEPGWAPARFDAYDEEGRLLCSGETRALVLGTRPD